MLSNKQITHISKFLSLVLRHKPETIQVRLDENGWVDVDELLLKVNAHGIIIDREALNHVVETNAKKRFAFNDQCDKIRASQGHSIAIELGYTPQIPPVILYHGTSIASVQSILDAGLNKRNRQHVHLSFEMETALNVGQRHGKPYIFEVLAKQMHAEGYLFFKSENGVWLTNDVPTKYLRPVSQ
ncbi:MAG: putative RNA 2'-phosphotransferase [Crocinitomix sp.]